MTNHIEATSDHRHLAAPTLRALNFLPVAGCKPANGYGKLEIALWSALVALGVRIRPLTSFQIDGLTALSDQAWAELRCPPPLATDTLVIGNPALGNDPISFDSRLWLYTMSESTRVSDEWVADINLLYQGVMVPAPELVKVYQQSGVRVPVHYVPMGVTPPPPVARPQRKSDRFVFLTYSLGETRKGAELAAVAFRELFGGDKRYQLLIKTPADPAPWHRAVASEQINIVNGSISEQAWAELLAEADCFVFPSRGEGFGLPPREATLLGTPAIATAWLGLWDVDKWGYPIGVKELRPAPFLGDANHPNALWAEPSMDDLKAQMAFVVEHHDQALEQTEHGRAYLSAFTWEATAKGILEVICGGSHA